MTDLLIRRDTPIPRGTRIAYRVILDDVIDISEDGWRDEGENTITLAELEDRIREGSKLPAYSPLSDHIIDGCGLTGYPIGDEEWVPLSMDCVQPHFRSARFETSYESEHRRYAAERGEYVTLDQPCCPVCGSFKADSCDACEDGIPEAVAS